MRDDIGDRLAVVGKFESNRSARWDVDVPREEPFGDVRVILEVGHKRMAGRVANIESEGRNTACPCDVDRLTLSENRWFVEFEVGRKYRKTAEGI